MAVGVLGVEEPRINLGRQLHETTVRRLPALRKGQTSLTWMGPVTTLRFVLVQSASGADPNRNRLPVISDGKTRT